MDDLIILFKLVCDCIVYTERSLSWNMIEGLTCKVVRIDFFGIAF